MTVTAVVAFVLSVCTALRSSQAKTLADLVAAAVGVGRVRLAALGRRLRGDALCKHKIKRTWRFCTNHRVTVADGMQGVLDRLARRHRHAPLLVALDWVEVRTFHTLMAAAVLGGRAVPLLWASYPEWELYKSQNNLEEGLLRLLKSLLPERVEVLVLADRGFGRAELARACVQIGIHYLIRIKPDAGCRDNTVRLFDVASRQQVAELRGHTDYVHAVAWSPDGTRLVSGSGDFTVRVWDSLSVQERARRAADARQP